MATVMLAVLLIVNACAEGGGRSTPAPSAAVEVPPRAAVTTAQAPPASTAPVARSPFAARITDIGSATYEPEAHAAVVEVPTFLSIPAIRLDASIVPVGVLSDGSFEVPDARLVGWYRFGPTPADDGVTVLAAHLNFDGVNGAFRRLGDVEVDDQVIVASGDGQTRVYRVTARRLIDKTQLPPDEIWVRSGPPRLVLITCGGRYDAERRGYDDNVVVFAEPI